MTEKKEKKKTPLKMIGLVATVFFFFVFLVTSFFGERGWIEIFRAQKKKDVLLSEIAELEKRKADLERDIEELENNPLAVERKAREKLWLMEPDEIVIIKK